MGTVSGDDNAHDRLLIDTSSAGQIYDGGVGTGELTKLVVGSSRSRVGDFLCTSGAFSGSRCNIRVQAINQTISVGYLIFQAVMAEQIDRTNAAGNGDSGGPVLSLSADPNKVIAKGTITAIDSFAPAPCTGVPAGGGRTCSWRMFSIDVADSLTAYGATIVASSSD